MAVIVGKLMKHLMVLLVIISKYCAYSAMSRSLYEAPVAYKFEQWMADYERTYADVAEKEKRFQIFKENLGFIEDFNNAAGNKSYYTLGLNQFSDLTTEEFLAAYTGFKNSRIPKSSKMAPYETLNSSQVPISIDWRDNGAVTPIKSQGSQCGSCWAFSAVGAVEGLTKIKTGNLTSLSEQQLVDCARNQENDGCHGGVMDAAFQYIVQNNGIANETNYPYEGTDGTCNTSQANLHAAQISGYKDVPSNSEDQLLQAVANQPVAVGISVNDLFRAYKEGIFSGPCGTTINHAVTLIGYNTTEDGTKYWLIKNSWDEGWGENGYMRLVRDNGTAEGLCGIAMEASYPTA